jgi:phosphate starvation-inducible protein PhoH and related proteins
MPDISNQTLANLCGPLDEHLAILGTGLGVKITRRGSSFSVTGDRAALAKEVLRDLLVLAEKRPLSELDLRIHIDAQNTPSKFPDEEDRELIMRFRGVEVRGRNAKQVGYLRSIKAHDIAFGIGPAGTGKTFLAVACALQALEQDQVKRVLLTRPAVEAGERLGYLPGDLAQKVDPYLRPLYDALNDLYGADRVAKLFERGSLEVAPLAFMRGRTLNHSFVILDEAQNTTPEQMKMFLTRIGFGSKAVVTGDVSQVDLKPGQKSGLIDAGQVLRNVPGIGITEFASEEVIRHPLVAKIVDAYAARESAERAIRS